MFSRTDMIKTKNHIEKRIERITHELKYWKDVKSTLGMTNYEPFLDFLSGRENDRLVSETGLSKMIGDSKKLNKEMSPSLFPPKPTDFETDLAIDTDIVAMKNLILEDSSAYKPIDFENPQRVIESLTNGCPSASESIELDEKTAYTLFQKLERAGKVDTEELYHSMCVQMSTNFLVANSDRNINDLISETIRIAGIRKKQLLEMFNGSQDMKFVLQRRAWVQYTKTLTLQKIIHVTYGLRQGITFEDLEETQEELKIETIK